MVDLDKVFSDFEEADPTAGGGRNPKIKVAGDFIVEVEEVRFVESQQYAAVYFVVEMKVLTSSKKDEVIEGDSYSWTHDMLNKWYGAANTKQFIAAACGLDPASKEAKAITRNEVEEAWAPKQPLKGTQVKLHTFPKTTKGGFDIVVHDWSPM